MAQALVDEAVWGAHVASIGALERELMRLRRAASAHAKEQARSVARAAVLNLVVYADRETHARRAAESSARLADRHPSRAIVILGDREREGVEVAIKLHCHVPRPDEGAQVCYEQILARVNGDADERVASVVIPLLVPDLSVFLWWTGTPPHDTRRFDDLIALADRLIVDSADFARPAVTLAVIADVAKTQRERKFGITDLNWTRLTPWRELVAAFFDVDAWRPCLDNIVGVRVGFSVDADGRDIHPSQALLLIGWLASRLGWQAIEELAPSEAGGHLFRMASANDQPIVVRVRPRFERGVEPGDTSGLRIQAKHAGDLYEFVLKREPDPRHVTATVLQNGETRSRRVVLLPDPGIEELLREELSIVGSDHVFEDALRALVALA
ncbi:MAG TPA: glucose-6-phosphate dehydrogenase assembly protein OpcA [Candidatus Limnocylindrales bacterium]|nr:glucose-6-phosphate dehydrogenase assembly protein OpcA [Candidatus Limnocylindrales bacterium]